MAWTTPKTWATGDLVTAVDLNTHLRDNLNALKGVPITAANFSMYTGTTSTAFVDIGSAYNLTITVSEGSRLLIGLWGSWSIGAGGYTSYLDLLIDSTRAGHTTDGLQQLNVSSYGEQHIVPFSILYVSSALSAGAHTIKPQYRTENSSSGTYIRQIQIWARELPVT